MAKPELSPGPWSLERREDCSGFKIVDADGCLVEYISESRYVDEREDPIAEANALAMAAVPVMLAALQRARMSTHHSACNHGGQLSHCTCHVGAAYKAIVAATGREP